MSGVERNAIAAAAAANFFVMVRDYIAAQPYPAVRHVQSS
jgi:hypothetical protein